MTPKVKTTTDLVPIIGWERVSTDHQDMARQDADLDRLKTIHSLDYKRIVKLELSGRHVDGDPEVEAVLNEIANNPLIQGIACSSLDRLFRHERYDSGKILDVFKDHHKVIYSAKEGLVDPGTSSGYMLCMMAMMQSGLEWRELRRRSNDQKAVYRLRGWNVCGGLRATPRGVIFERVKMNGRTVDGKWRYDGVYSEKVKQAFYILLEMGSRPNYVELVRRIGGGYTSQGIRDALQNRIWIGERVYDRECSTSPEYMPDPKKRKGGKRPLKKRRKAVKLTDPLIVKIDLEPLVPIEVFNRAQEIINAVHTNHERARVTNADRSRFLANGLMWCACGKILYCHYDARNERIDKVYCSTQYKKGISCGAPRLNRIDVDRTLTELFTSSVLKADTIRAIEAGLRAKCGKKDIGRVVREKKLAELKDQRETVNDMRQLRKIDRADWLKRLEGIENEEKALLASAPRVEVPYDPVDTAKGLVEVFCDFSTLPFADQRKVLRAAISRITIDGSAIMSIDFNGGFLSKVSGPIGKTPENGATRPTSPWSSWACCTTGIPGPDLTVILQKPLQIQRSKRGSVK